MSEPVIHRLPLEWDEQEPVVPEFLLVEDHNLEIRPNLPFELRMTSNGIYRIEFLRNLRPGREYRLRNVPRHCEDTEGVFHVSRTNLPAPLDELGEVATSEPTLVARRVDGRRVSAHQFNAGIPAETLGGWQPFLKFFLLPITEDEALRSKLQASITPERSRYDEDRHGHLFLPEGHGDPEDIMRAWSERETTSEMSHFNVEIHCDTYVEALDTGVHLSFQVLAILPDGQTILRSEVLEMEHEFRCRYPLDVVLNGRAAIREAQEREQEEAMGPAPEPEPLDRREPAVPESPEVLAHSEMTEAPAEVEAGELPIWEPPEDDAERQGVSPWLLGGGALLLLILAFLLPTFRRDPQGYDGSP